MARIGVRSFWTVLTATVVVAFAGSLLGCASLGPGSRVAVSDVKSVMGTWKGIVYRSSVEREYAALTIHQDSSYDLVSGGSQGKGKIIISDGRLVLEGAKGRGVGTLVRNPAGDLSMNIDATLNDNSTLTAKLSPSR